jgi:hypothetical protein
MARVISVHEYELPDVQEVDFERALREAKRSGLFDLPGLTGHHFLRGLKGARRGGLYRDLDFRESRSLGETLGDSGSPAAGQRVPGKLESLGKYDPGTLPHAGF